ncbi:TIGR03086 family metal-binding protein [Nocardia bovistercoris]|uniref:TIGR03086 family protein n=1 Tax=Nocardia bovistercoris TaxID=2785916 RepID=A0A931IFG3_9NOCA|nr:TIGR03086 family metal-binding protein [Nocardia bovistercoris]MBH0779578.1 TIGR03086 family protein [Nocardia bovistercoris]
MSTDTENEPIATELAAFEALAESGALIEHHAAAVRVSIELVDHVTTADLRTSTPCADWTLHGLLTHMIAQHRGFAAAAHGNGDPQLWKTRPLGPDPAAEYRTAAESVLAAFAEPDVLAREFPLPEFSPTHPFPGSQAVIFHFIDYVVHSWDVAATLALPVRFDPAVLTAAHTVVAVIPGGPSRRAPGAPFAPEVPWSGGGTLDEIVAMLGRAPDWTRD